MGTQHCRFLENATCLWYPLSFRNTLRWYNEVQNVKNLINWLSCSVERSSKNIFANRHPQHVASELADRILHVYATCSFVDLSSLTDLKKPMSCLGELQIKNAANLRDMGSTLDANLSFKEHCGYAAKKKSDRVARSLLRSLRTNTILHFVLAYNS